MTMTYKKYKIEIEGEKVVVFWGGGCISYYDSLKNATKAIDHLLN